MARAASVRKIGARLLRNPVLREPYRFVRRAFEIWVDHGLAFVFKFAARKIGAGPARAAADRRGPYLDADPRRLRDVDRTNHPAPRLMPRCAQSGRTSRTHRSSAC